VRSSRVCKLGFPAMNPTDSFCEALVAEFSTWPPSAPRRRPSPRRPSGISTPDEEAAQAFKRVPGEVPKGTILAGPEELAYRLSSLCESSCSVRYCSWAGDPRRFRTRSPLRTLWPGGNDDRT